ncbi:MAG: hypothetical protein K6E79_00130 [Pseudobutyrivibrio sp.]|nr:hypothetical protein [Pseudobutyrivibrio sp.]
MSRLIDELKAIQMDNNRLTSLDERLVNNNPRGYRVLSISDYIDGYYFPDEKAYGEQCESIQSAYSCY